MEIPKLYIHGDVDNSLFSAFSQQLAELEAAKKVKAVEIELISDGGSAYDALAFHDRIINSRLDIRITGLGLIASAAVLILAAGDHRRLTRNAWVMVHEDDCGSLNKRGMVHQAEKDVAHLRRLENQWNFLMAASTKTPTKHWAKLHKDETYMTPEQCKSLGLIEEIV